ncbi:hypothetical protein MMC26_006640 [Xylographa opegraphella]|nr:hypothetical protein [Xylographa opegraphella]
MPPRISRKALPSSTSPQLAQLPIPRCQCVCPSQSHFFSSSPYHETRQRQQMFRWLNGPGSVFRNPFPGSTNYLNAYDASGKLIRLQAAGRTKPKDADEELDDLSDEDKPKNTTPNIASGESLPPETADDLMPFPLNRQFRSQAVLSDELKEEIYKRVTQQGKSVRLVSAELGVEMRRVGAVVRLKSVEKEWVDKGKPLAGAYARAVLGMLPQTPFSSITTPVPHESINDLPVHRDTLRQIFHPVSESRQFTRLDAGKVFNHTLLPADERIPHPELVEMARVHPDGLNRQERVLRARERMRIEDAEKEEKENARREREERETTRVMGARWEFRFRDVDVESRVREGKGARVGARYGVPHQDRKRGQIKIPTRVE